MPSFAKSPAALVERFSEVMGERSDVDRRQMFGYPCAFVGGNMVTGLHEAAWFVRLAPDDAAELLALDGAGAFEPMPGRPMRGYTTLPPAIIADDPAIRRWVERSVAFGHSLPPKAGKTATKRRANTG
jgi:TfoX/Sxy family transcriptional regulator of competence genes